MRIYLKNNPAKFRPDPIWNGSDISLFWRSSSQQEQEQQEE